MKSHLLACGGSRSTYEQLDFRTNSLNHQALLLALLISGSVAMSTVPQWPSFLEVPS